MKKHTRIYYEFFDYALTEVVFSELSGDPAVDINHIDCKGMGGSKLKDFIENLIALTRDEHVLYGDKKQYMEFLYIRHIKFIRDQRPTYKVRFDRIPLAYRDAVMNAFNDSI